MTVPDLILSRGCSPTPPRIGIKSDGLRIFQLHEREEKIPSKFMFKAALESGDGQVVAGESSLRPW